LPHKIGSGITLAVLWLMLSGIYDNTLILLLGVISIGAVLFVAHRMDVIDHEGHPSHLGFGMILYFPWLLWEIVKANLVVAKIIISPRMEIQPHIFTIQASQQSEVGNVVYSHSITLTPGTVTVDVEDGEMSVHALTNAAAAGVKTGEMDSKVTKLETSGKGAGNV